MSFLDLLERLHAQRRRHLEDLPSYLRLIKEVVLRHDPNAEVFLFGVMQRARRDRTATWTC